MSGSLFEVFARLITTEELDREHIVLERNRQGGLVIEIVPDWIDSLTLQAILGLAREHELAASLTEDGIRIESHTSGVIQGVEQVKRILRDDEEGDERDT